MLHLLLAEDPVDRRLGRDVDPPIGQPRNDLARSEITELRRRDDRLDFPVLRRLQLVLRRPDGAGAAIRTARLLSPALQRRLVDTEDVAGFSLLCTGVEGLREVMAMDFDVIICDLMMPTMPGDMFYLAVQKVKPNLCRRFLFVTGHGDEPRVNSFLHKTDGLVVFKPVPSVELVQMISLVLKRNEA